MNYVIQSVHGRQIDSKTTMREVYSGTTKYGVHKFTTSFHAPEWIVYPSEREAVKDMCKMSLNPAEYEVKPL